jgi:hypothetical protein
MNNMVNNKAVTAHLFEYTTTFALDPDLHFRYPDKGIMPTQVIFCMKEKNQKKINSHRWFFNAFGRMLQPNVCVLLDVGTKPGSKSIYHLWKTFDLNSNVGGACGEIAVYKGKYWSALLNPLGKLAARPSRRRRLLIYSSGGAELRVQDQQHPRQAHREHVRVYQCAAGCIFCLQIYRTSKRQNWTRAAGIVFQGRGPTRPRYGHFHVEHVYA